MIYLKIVFQLDLDVYFLSRDKRMKTALPWAGKRHNPEAQTTRVDQQLHQSTDLANALL